MSNMTKKTSEKFEEVEVRREELLDLVADLYAATGNIRLLDACGTLGKLEAQINLAFKESL